MTVHVCGAGMACLGFCCSLVIGLLAGNSFVTIVSRAVVVLAMFYVFGCILAGIGQKVIQQNFDREVEAVRTAEAAATEEATEATEVGDGEGAAQQVARNDQEPALAAASAG